MPSGKECGSGRRCRLQAPADRAAGKRNRSPRSRRRHRRPAFARRSDSAFGRDSPEQCVRHSRSTHRDRKSTRLNSSHSQISYAVFCLKKKKKKKKQLVLKQKKKHKTRN